MVRKKPVRRRANNRRLSFEALESRRLLSANVMARVRDGSLYVTGDNNNDTVAISGAGRGAYTIAGQNGTTINGHGTVTIAGVMNNVFISFLGGNDSLTLTNASFPGNVSIAMGNGADDVLIGQGSGYFVPETGVFGFGTGAVTIGRNLSVSLGNGGEFVYESMVNIGHDNSITAGDGTDNILLGLRGDIDVPIRTSGAPKPSLSIGHNFNVALNGVNDYVGLGDLFFTETATLSTASNAFKLTQGVSIAVGQDFNISLGGGLGNIELSEQIDFPPQGGILPLETDSPIGGNVPAVLSVGRDLNIHAAGTVAVVGFAGLVQPSAGPTGFLAEIGRDANIDLTGSQTNGAALGDSYIGRNLAVLADTGGTATLSYDTVAGSIEVASGNAPSSGGHANLEHVKAQLVVIIDGSSNESVGVSYSTLVGLAVNLGAGNDQLEIDHTTTTSSTNLDGGPGDNTYTNGGGNSLAKLKIVNFGG